ncbi:hypothetical protein B835_435 [Enterococcus mundtii 3F]|nr:hypothetical protein [Enterococcus mundtii 3F]
MVVPNEWEIERENLLSHHHDVTGSISYTVLVKVNEVLEDTNKEFFAYIRELTKQRKSFFQII